MKSYHVFTLSVGKHAVERIYIDEEVGTREDAERKLKRTQRARIIGHRIARPTRFHRENAERLGQPFPTPVGRHARRRAA